MFCRLLCGVLMLGLTASLDPQCTNYSYMSRESDRSKDNTLIGTDLSSVPCDNMADGWYRFRNGEIATSCVPTHHCGTTSTIWMKDPVPKIGETLDNDFCVNHQVGSSQASCCLFSFKVKVTNCDSYMVYYFKKDDVLCPSGYCTGDLKPCKNGGSSATGFEPCVYTSPSMDGPPTLHPPVPTSNGKDFTQKCHVNYSGTQPDASFLVMWLFNGAIFKQAVLENGVRTATLTSADWKGHIGQTTPHFIPHKTMLLSLQESFYKRFNIISLMSTRLKCIAQSYFSSQGKANHSHILESNQFYGGLQVSPDQIVIDEGSPEDISLISTLPILCDNLSPDSCFLALDMSLTAGSTDGIFADRGCTYRLKGSDWNQNSKRTEVVTQLSTLVDTVVKSDRNYTMTFNLRPSSTAYSQFKNHNKLDVNVTTRDHRHHMCIVVGESHVTGFNLPKNFKFGTYQGDVLLFKDENSTGKAIQVHARTWTAANGRASVCGVAVQYGDSLIRVEMCTEHTSLVAPVLTQGQKVADDVVVYLCDSNYEIVTANGVHISIHPAYLHLDMKIHLPPSYTSLGEGACGFDISHISWTHSDLKQYSLSAQESLFEDAAAPFLQVTASQDNPHYYCQCGGSHPICSPFGLVRDPMVPFTFDTNGMLISRPRCSKHTPHAINPDYGSPQKVFKPVPGFNLSGKEQSALTGECSDETSRLVPQYCVSKYQAEMSNFFSICSEDLVETGSKRLFTSGALALQWWCQEHAFSDEKTYSNSGGHLLPPGSLTTEICPNFCSMAGHCEHGTCICSFMNANDCQVPKRSKPIIHGIKGGDVCQMSSDHCTRPILVTEHVYPSDTLSVVMQPIKLINGFFQNTTTTYVVDPVYENKFSVSLSLSHLIQSFTDSTALGFYIRLSCDGAIYSDSFTYMIYDDKCLNCDVSRGRCLQKPNTCKIMGSCFYANEINPDDPSELCDPTSAVVHWTKKTQQASQAPLVGR